MTLKKALIRGLIGAPIAIFISYTISICMALSIPNNTEYTPVVPMLTQVMGNELKAVVLQYFLSALLGFAFAISSAVFEVDEWSITKQTIINFLISITAMFPIAYFCYWMDHTVGGIVSYIIVFVIIYAIGWIVQILAWRWRIYRINKRIMRK